MARRVFVGVMLFATLIIILVLCMAISQEGTAYDRQSAYLNNKACEELKQTVSTEQLCDKKQNNKVAYLTFDDGPSKNTKRILKVLDKYKIKATFFVVGNLINKEYGMLIKEMASNGHSIGIHTYSHNYKQIYFSKEQYLEDFYKAEDTIAQYLNNKTSIYRFPGGSCNCFIGAYKKDIIEELENKNYSYYDWNVSGEDSLNKPTVDSIIANVVKDYKCFEKPIILLHDGVNNENTVYALTAIIENIKSAGYSFDVLK